MSELRCRATDMCHSESMPFQQHHEYKTTWPLAECLHERFFASENYLRAGDKIEMCRFDAKDTGLSTTMLLEYAHVRVLSNDRNGGLASVKLALIGEIMVLAEAGIPLPEWSIHKGFAGKYRLFHGEDFVEEFGSKQEAEVALAFKTNSDMAA